MLDLYTSLSDSVRFEPLGESALVTLDDGKVNALGPALLGGLEAALERAEKESKALVLVGRPGRFSAGFDLSLLGGGGKAARDLVARGAELALRLIDFPLPVVAACSGHAIAMGALLLLASDFRVGAAGVFKIGLNEVAAGMKLPHFARELSRARLSRRHLLRATVQAEMYAPAAAVDAGFLDAVAEPEALVATARSHAERLAGLERRALVATRRGMWAPHVAEIRARLDEDIATLLPDA